MGKMGEGGESRVEGCRLTVWGRGDGQHALIRKDEYRPRRAKEGQCGQEAGPRCEGGTSVTGEANNGPSSQDCGRRKKQVGWILPRKDRADGSNCRPMAVSRARFSVQRRRLAYLRSADALSRRERKGEPPGSLGSHSYAPCPHQGRCPRTQAPKPLLRNPIAPQRHRPIVPDYSHDCHGIPDKFPWAQHSSTPSPILLLLPLDTHLLLSSQPQGYLLPTSTVEPP
jgi:hypothetical protein